MKKMFLLVIILVLLSVIADMFLAIVPALGETKEIQLIGENGLKLSYIYEEKTNQFLLNFERQSEENFRQRIKIRLTDEKDQTLAYPAETQMVEKDGWLVEEAFSVKQAGQVTFELNESIKILHLSVQLDQQGTDTNDIQADILKDEQPFVIDLEKKTVQSESKIEDQKEKQIIQASSEKFIGPKKETKQSNSIPTAKTNGLTSKMYEPIYENKQPQYKTDSSGTYPEFAWQPEGQLNVLNHQGGVENQAGWDNVTAWNVATDNHDKSYIKYGEDANDPNIQLRKYVQQTANEDEFKIKLNVRGNTTYKPGVDIVFLLDNTGSMISGGSTNKVDSADALKKIIEELEKVAKPGTDGIRIGGHIFASYDKVIEGDWNWTREKTHHKLSSNPADWRKIETTYRALTPAGDTFTQRGLQEAQDIFDDPTTATGEDRHKLLFILTDGAPTSSWKPLTAESDPSLYYDPTLITSFETGSKPDYLKGTSLGADSNKSLFNSPLTVNGQKISSHLTTTNSTAHKLKAAGIEIHSLAVKISSSGKDHPKADLLQGLYKMATKKANAGKDDEKQSDYFFYHAEKSSELTEYVKAWYQRIIRTVDKGEIMDPLGDMVELVTDEDKKPKVTQVDNGAPKIETVDLPNISITDGQINVDNVNLTGNQEIELEYTVRLKTDEIVSNQWYQTNKTTTLKPTPERTTDLVEFGSPSVRLRKADFVIPVKKVWEDTHQGTADYWKLRAAKVTATLQRWDGKAWQDVESKELSEANKWEAKFTAVKGGSENSYRVVENSRINGYEAPVINQDSFTSDSIAAEGIVIINKLLRGSYTFNKFMEDGKTAFTADLPKFQIKRSDGKILAQDVTPNNEGQVIFNDVPIGAYIIEETYVPVGFHKMADFELNVTENAAADGLVFKVNDKTEVHTVVNKLKDFSLKLQKVDPADNPLAGASFKLVGPNYEVTKVGGPTFDFTNLRPGSYTLTETENPEGYQRIKEPITFEIAIDGKVTISAHPDVSGTGGVASEGNLIELKVTNKRVRPGALPNTGAFGIHNFYWAAGIFMSVGVLLSGVYAYYNRRQ